MTGRLRSWWYRCPVWRDYAIGLLASAVLGCTIAVCLTDAAPPTSQAVVVQPVQAPTPRRYLWTEGLHDWQTDAVVKNLVQWRETPITDVIAIVNAWRPQQDLAKYVRECRAINKRVIPGMKFFIFLSDTKRPETAEGLLALLADDDWIPRLRLYADRECAQTGSDEFVIDCEPELPLLSKTELMDFRKFQAVIAQVADAPWRMLWRPSWPYPTEGSTEIRRENWRRWWAAWAMGAPRSRCLCVVSRHWGDYQAMRADAAAHGVRPDQLLCGMTLNPTPFLAGTAKRYWTAAETLDHPVWQRSRWWCYVYPNELAQTGRGWSRLGMDR